MREGKEETGPKRISHLKLLLQLLLCLKAPDLKVRGREKWLRLRKHRLATREPGTPSLLLGYPPLPLKRRKQTNRPAMTNIQNPNCLLGKSPIFLHVPTEEKRGRGNVSERRRWTRTGRESGLLTQISKDVAEESITPEDAATGGRTVAEAGELVVEAERSTLTESHDHAQIYLLLEVLLPSATGRKVRRVVRAQTLRLYQNVGDAVVQTQIRKVKVGGNLPAILDPLTVSPAPNLAVHCEESSLGSPGLDLTSQALDLLTWGKRWDPEGTMKAGPSQDFFPKESPLGEEEEDYTVDEVEQENVAALARPHSDGHQLENPLLSGPLNPWRHSDLKTLSPHQDMTILPMTDGPLSLMARNLGMGLLRVVENGPVDPDRRGRPGKTNPLALGA